MPAAFPEEITSGHLRCPATADTSLIGQHQCGPPPFSDWARSSQGAPCQAPPTLNHKGKIQILTCGVTLGTFSISVDRLKFTSRRHQKWSPPIHHNLWGYINGIGILGSEQNPAEWKRGNNFSEKVLKQIGEGRTNDTQKSETA
jgi:hypothetical protein